MSATTGPRSPTSPWPQESQGLALPGPSSPAAFFPLSDSRPPTYKKISPRGAASELPDSNYFSFNTEGPNNIKKHRGHLSHALPHESPEGSIVSERDLAEQQSGPRSASAIPDAAFYRSSLNRSSETRDSISSALKATPTPSTGTSVSPVSTEKCAELVGSYADDLMLLDVRPFAHFSKGSIKRALNLCIPTTLLKRPSFDTKKLANTFTDEGERRNFGRWMQCRYIIVYDASTSNMKDAIPLTNVLKKFAAEGWTGNGMILMGGFKAFSSKFPQLTQQEQQRTIGTQFETTSPMHIGLPQSAPVAGGCNIPESSNAAIPFFGNIRQHMDLVGGVGQIALKLPKYLTESRRRHLPPWLRDVSDPADQGRIAASRFFEIEKTELERMKQALSYDQTKDSTNKSSSPGYRVAGIEKGTKNRYNDIYPFEHSRVKLHDIPHGGCDYVNASYLKAANSNRNYIATQAPVPDTFNDFWRVIWEQDVRLVVSLTAEVERGQVKCHPYWKSGTYGPFYVNNFSKKKVPIGPSNAKGVQAGEKKSPVESAENPTLVVRHFGLTSHLFPLLKRRACKQLCGSQFDASSTTFKFDDQVPNPKASLLASHAGVTLALISCRHQSAVRIFQVREGQILAHSRAKLPQNQSGSVEILKTAFDGDDRVYILHRFTPSLDEDDLDGDHAYMKQARASGRDGIIYLTCHSLRRPDDPVRVTTFPEHVDFEPSALAVTVDGSFAISWCHRILSDHMVILYIISDRSEYIIEPDLFGFSYSSRQMRQWVGNTRGPLISEILFNDRSSQLLYHYQAKSLYASYQKIDLQGPTNLHDNSTLVQFTEDTNLLFSIGIPFFGTHETIDLDGYAVCRWRYLSVGIATHRKDGWTVACLLSSEATCRASRCGHTLNLCRGRRLEDWLVVARLWGFRDSTNSLGCKVAASANGTRVAVANWNLVYVWALEPGALIDMDPEGYYHPSWRSSSTGQIELRPFFLQLNAVCFQLRFTDNENELVAITDRGVMLWDLTPFAGRRRSYQELPSNDK
ncbi:hypothetical protein BDV06DRAFT_214209 [Aspergillus oleicola]